MTGHLVSNIFSFLLIVGFLFYSYRVNKLLDE
ncbi:MAG: hypothetical protein H6Q68_78 [Firmicutes bacterium]|nr:hypothetical protein [Bacillota bacterium]